MDDDSDSEADSISNLICNVRLKSMVMCKKHIAMLFVIFFKGGKA